MISQIRAILRSIAASMKRRPRMTSLEKAIRDLAAKSDIAFNGDVYEEIACGLTGIGLNLAFFVFENSVHSYAARTLEDGRNMSCPILSLYLKHDDDFRRTGIDPHRGNRGDKWPLTGRVRDTVNAVLQRHEYGSDYVSERTFVFVRTLEELAFSQLGRECKDAVLALIRAEAPGAKVTHVFWNGEQYYLVMRDKGDYKRVKRAVKTKITKALPGLFAAADADGCCQSYPATIEFGYTGMSLFGIMRDYDWL